jgi:hypothetical protein
VKICISRPPNIRAYDRATIIFWDEFVDLLDRVKLADEFRMASGKD